MVRKTLWWWMGLFTIGTLMLAFADGNSAQEKKAHEKHDTAPLYNSLREVINKGAQIFNDQGDHAGCYRMFQGSLLSVRPFLDPDLQKKIDQSMSEAEKLPNYADRAFKLREALDEVRAQTKPAGEKIPIAKKKEEKKIEEKKKDEEKKKEAKKTFEEKKKTTTEPKKTFEEKKKTTTEPKKTFEEKKKTTTEPKKTFEEKKKTTTEMKKKTTTESKKKTTFELPPKTTLDPKNASATSSGDKGQLLGKVKFEGKPIEGGYFVTLISSNGKKFSSAIQKDGSFQFKTPLPVGDYRIALESIPGEDRKGTVLPARYGSGEASGLTVRMKEGKQQADLELTK